MTRVKRWFWLLAIPLGTCSGTAQTYSPLVREIIDGVSLDSLVHTVKVLSGEVGSSNGGMSDTIHGRYVYDSGHDVARDYLKRKLDSYGLSTELRAIDVSPFGTSVLGTQTGASRPGAKYILCAHYDDITGQPEQAPGADDNASGCAAVLEAARILSRYKTAYTIVYALWDQEEDGQWGAQRYARDAAARGDSILGVINLDMLGWDGNNDSLIEISTDSVAHSMQLADTVASVLHLYNFPLKPIVQHPGSGGDHFRFWQYGFTAVKLADWPVGGDYNPHMHEIDDRIQYFNLLHFHGLAALAAGTAAFLTGVEDVTSAPRVDPVVWVFSLEQNYPNPFNPKTEIKFQVSSVSDVKIAVYDLLGREVAVLVNEQKVPGSYEVDFDGSRLASGVYIYRLTAGSFTESHKMILTK